MNCLLHGRGTRCAIVVSLLLSGCTLLPTTPPAEPAAVVTAPPVQPDPLPEPAVRPFPDDSFHDLLVAEFALRRNRFDIALGNYIRQARETRDAGVTRQATRLAKFLGADTATLDAAQLWIELEPDNLEAQYTVATLLARKGRPLQAMPYMQRVLEQGGDSNFAVIAASALKQPGEEQAALEEQLRSLLLRFPDDPQILTGLALLVQQRGEPEQALALIQRALADDGSNVNAALVETRLLQQLGRSNDALTRVAQILRSNPANRRLRLEYARQLMASDLQAAREQFLLLLQEAPNDPDLLLSTALISSEMGDFETAEIHFQRLLETGQRNNEAWFYLGQIAEQQQQWQLAIDYYQLVTPSADFIKAHSRIAWLYSQRGDLASAPQSPGCPAPAIPGQ